MTLKIEFLVKKELIYEARLRGIDVGEDILVYDLRKKLRELIKLGVRPNPTNLAGRINGGEEYELIKLNVENLKEKVEDLVESKCISDLIRCEVKVTHYENRLKILKTIFTSSETGSSKVDILQETLNSLKEMLRNINIDLKEKESIEQEITKNGEIEDEFEQSLTNRAVKPVSQEPVHVGPFAPQASVRDSVYSGGSNLTYARLPNPLERYLNKFQTTDGLNAQVLIKFIKNMLALKEETKIKDHEILEILLGYCHGPLYAKILKCKEERATICETHLIILKQFIPMGLRENMKKELVNRPQRSGEALEVYIHDIKVNSEVLNTRYTEEEVVEIIKLGINPETRAKLVFMGNPTSYEDLDQMCIQVQNVGFNDTQRREMRTYTPPRVSRPINNVNDRRTCFICNKYGHLAKDCYQNKQTTHRTETKYTPSPTQQQFNRQSVTPPRQTSYNRPTPSRPNYNQPKNL